MGAHPKNKITRVEQGKRRAGNTPKLLRDANKAIPMHKRSLFDKLMNILGNKPVVADEPKKEKVSKAATADAPNAAKQAKAAPTKGAMTVKKTTRTQHKGG